MFDVEGRRAGVQLQPQRPVGVCRAEIKDGQSLAGLLHYTQQTEVITLMGGADFMTSWWNNEDVDLFLCCKNNRGADGDVSRVKSQLLQG